MPRHGITQNIYAYNTALQACSALGDLQQLKELCNEINYLGLEVDTTTLLSIFKVSFKTCCLCFNLLYFSFSLSLFFSF